MQNFHEKFHFCARCGKNQNYIYNRIVYRLSWCARGRSHPNLEKFSIIISKNSIANLKILRNFQRFYKDFANLFKNKRITRIFHCGRGFGGSPRRQRLLPIFLKFSASSIKVLQNVWPAPISLETLCLWIHGFGGRGPSNAGEIFIFKK